MDDTGLPSSKRSSAGPIHPLQILVPDAPAPWKERFPQHQWWGRDELASGPIGAPQPHPPGRPFQVLFTSGSTGEPKAVVTTVDGMAAFLSFVLHQIELTPQDRCSQLFDLAWDPHGHDLWVTWSTGACLVGPSREQLMFPARYITEARLTSWYGVPSSGLMMDRQRALVSEAFPELRYAPFGFAISGSQCGLPLRAPHRPVGGGWRCRLWQASSTK